MKVKTADIEVNYDLSGGPDKPVVVLSHPLGASLEIWDPQVAALSSHFRILRYDTRGHGGTSAPTSPYTMDLLVADALSLLDTLEIDKVHWVGLSMGGMIGQGLAILNPERLWSVSLCNTISYTPEHVRKIWKLRMQSTRPISMQDVVDHGIQLALTEKFRNSHNDQCEEIKRRSLLTSFESYVACTSAVMNCNYTDQLSTIRTPTLVIASEQDMAIPFEDSEHLHKLIPDSIMETIPTAAHLSNVEESESFNEILLSFLNSVYSYD